MYKKFLNFAIFFAFVVVILGAWTRLADAGLGCPDWPGCYGHLTVPALPDGSIIEGFERPLEAFKGWMEMIHRYAAGILGLLIFAITYFVMRGKPHYHQSLGLPIFLSFFVILQAAFGMWTVTLKVHPIIVTTHLLGGFATSSMIFWLRLKQSRPQINPTYVPGKVRLLSLIVLIAIVLQIIMGGWVSTNYAALSCGTDFPTCQGQWWPTMDFGNAFFLGPLGQDYEFGVLENPARTAIQMIHRIGAVVVLSLSLILLASISRYRHMKGNVVAIALILFTQIVLGIINVVWSLPLPVAVAHNAVALMLLLSILALIHKMTRPL
ncbi:MAG: heme A synthase [Gammaproteobacteria bacterium]|jgi:cytochrome c oxidase assembly protein subunit 15|nr:heme A synthase [Gammaproteobacteria bacterium]